MNKNIHILEVGRLYLGKIYPYLILWIKNIVFEKNIGHMLSYFDYGQNNLIM